MFGLLGRILIGAALGGVATAATVAIVRYIHVKRLNKERLKKEKEAEEKFKNTTSAKINECRRTGNVSYVKVGLYDDCDNHIADMNFEADEIDESEIYEGAVITI